MMTLPTSAELIRGQPTAESPTQPSSRDIAVLLEALDAGMSFEAEDLNRDQYLERVIEKPWGHEYRVYADLFYDIWKLRLLPQQSTSVHCHPRKETALLCLSGNGEVQFLDSGHPVRAGDIVQIPRAVFHGTRNVSSSQPLHLVEVEVPRNKLDLVRLTDNYGRQGTAYEKKTLEAALTELHSFHHESACRIRSSCLSGKYRFVVRAGMDIRCRPEAGTMFVVSLSPLNACISNIEVAVGLPVSIDNNDFYLTISCT